MTETDIEMTGMSSSAEDPSVFVNGIIAADAEQRKRNRKAAMCARCQAEVAVPKIRKKRSKAMSDEKKLANFRKCQEAKHTKLAFNALKKAMGDLRLKQLAQRLMEDEAAKLEKIEKELIRITPLIDAMELRRLQKKKQSPSELPVIVEDQECIPSPDGLKYESDEQDDNSAVPRAIGMENVDEFDINASAWDQFSETDVADPPSELTVNPPIPSPPVKQEIPKVVLTSRKRPAAIQIPAPLKHRKLTSRSKISAHSSSK